MTAVMCAGEGHGAAVTLISSACVHEHVRVDVPNCAECTEDMHLPGWCCKTCHGLGDASHCCPLTLTFRPIPQAVAL